MKTLNFIKCLAPAIAVAFLISSSVMHAEDSISASELQKKIRLVIEKSGPAVVGLTPEKAGGAGSGVIVSEDGLILSAAHVTNAGSGEKMTVWLSDGRQVSAKKLGSQTGRDAAMLQIEGGGKWPFVDVRKGNPGGGEWVVAMGHPGGFQPERTPPVRLGRVLNVPDKGSKRGFLVSDSAVAGGDSGGPLFDLQGRVVGIHSSIGMSIEENRHVPISAYNDDWDRLVKGESWGGRMFAGGRPREGAILGVQLALSAGGEGALVEGVVDGSPAAKAGIRSGDVIVRFSGENIGDASALVDAVGGKKPGDKVKVFLRRGEEEKEVEVELGDAAKMSSHDSEGVDGRFMQVRKEERARAIPARNQVPKPSFGVQIGDTEDGSGAEVMAVVPGSVAARAGIEVGDVIVGFAGKKIAGAEALVNAVRGHGGGGAPVKVKRAGKDLRLDAKFAAEKSGGQDKAESPKAGDAKDAGREGREEGDRGGFRPQAKGFFFDGEKMREVEPERLREMLRRGGFPGAEGIRRPELGVEIEEGDRAVVAEVIPGSLAQKSGIRKGDVIVELAGRKVTDFDSLVAAVREMPARRGEGAKVQRGGKEMEIELAIPTAPRMLPPGTRRFGFRMKDGKVVPMSPEEFEKLVPELRNLPGGDDAKRPDAGKAMLGVAINPDGGGEGLLVETVIDGSAAAKAGLKAGDRILDFAGEKVGDFEQLAEAVGARKPGEKVKLNIVRDGKKREVVVELGRAPDREFSGPTPGGERMSPEKMREMMERMRRGEIQPEDIQRMFGGKVPMRGGLRVDPKLKRANGETLKGFAPAAAKARNSVVTVTDGGKRVAMGTVVAGGRVLTKASQIAGKKALRVERPDGEVTGVKVLRKFEKQDLALLELENADGLVPLRFANSDAATVGTLVTTPNPKGNPVGFGVVSVAARSLSEENKGFLGIQIGGASDAGVVIGQAFEGGAAQKAGLRLGDVIVEVGGVKVTSPTALIRQVAGKKPDEVVVINYVRGGKKVEVKVKLRSRADMGPGAERMSQTAKMGTRLSAQRSGYPSAFTHDMPVDPEYCGSPLINLEGDVVGINIARAGRTKTYALPGEVIRTLLSEASGERGKTDGVKAGAKGGDASALASLKVARESVAVARRSYEQLRKEALADRSLRGAADAARQAMEAAQKALEGAEDAYREIDGK